MCCDFDPFYDFKHTHALDLKDYIDMGHSKLGYELKEKHLIKIAEVKEILDYMVLASIVVALVLASLSLINVWVASIYIIFVFAYQFIWSNDALITKLDNIDCSYEFNEQSFKDYAYQNSENSSQIAFEAACILLEAFDESEIIERSGETFYDDLLGIVEENIVLNNNKAA